MQSQIEGTEPKKIYKAAKKPTAAKKAAPKKSPKGKTAYQTVLEIINRSKKGVTTKQLKTKTGFNDKKIANIIFKARKEGNIKSEKKGLYIKA